MDYQYRFTVFTPCYNSIKFLNRVFESLEGQTFRNFEWLVINDASTDGTDKLIEEFIKIANFPINYINLGKNQMVSANINLAFQEAKGELFVFAGHDDRIMFDALEEFDKIWTQYGNERLSGIKCLCQDQNGQIIGEKFPSEMMITDYFTVSYKLKYDREKFGCTRTSVLKEFPFDLSVSPYIPEGVLWGRIGMKYQTIWVNKVFRVYYIESTNDAALTKTGRKKYAAGIQYFYLVWINEFQFKLKNEILFKLRVRFAYTLYNCLLNKNIISIIKPVNRGIDRLQILFIYPMAFCFSKYLSFRENRNSKNRP